MAVRQTGRKVYKSMQGKSIDMDLLRQKNELTPAVGNARVNARGDELGPGGKIVRKREDVLEDYYRDTPNQVPDEAPVATGESEIEHKADAVEEEIPEVDKVFGSEEVQDEDVENSENWVEDDDGNFVKKGE